MSQNPYMSPRAPGMAVGVRSGRREDVYAVARYQRGVIVCLLLAIILNIAQVFIPEPFRLLGGLALLTAGVASMVFVILLAIKVYHPILGVLLGILALVPCIGLLALLVVNGKATRILQENGIRVGFFGADLSQIS
ncbi:MAG: hypothetical protein KatS3mg109_2308 [Pirellulaceae bacterium]|nr:MAG: hypothetical protein KatS3mg109_2308 [Pirellulaceae bacterium]